MRTCFLFLTAAVGAAVLGLQVPLAQPAPFDLVIKNARLVDGTGQPSSQGDVAVRGDAIVKIAPTIAEPALRTLDAQGQVLAPGFIDIHTHARRGIFEVPTADNYVRQGVTTLVEGPDGSSDVPLGPFLARVDALQKTPNFASMIGQGSIRTEVIGLADRRATPAEIERMRGMVEQGMRDGAFGLSSGLFYVPGTFTPTDEVVELAKVAARFGGIYISHMRDETAHVVDSVNETIAIGEQGGLPTQVTHHKIIGNINYGKSVDTLKAIDAARARGVDATIDQYPYTASSTSVQAALLPAWAQEGGRPAILKRLKDPVTRAKIQAETVVIMRDARGGGDPKNVQLARCDWDHTLDGKTLEDVIKRKDWAKTPQRAADAAFWLVEQGGCSGIFHAISEDDIDRIMRHPMTMIASDGEVVKFGAASPHPRSYGTFVRVLGQYVRERHVITLEEAIHKMSAMPAHRLGLRDRGLLEVGKKADLVVFDPAVVRDLATFEKPHQYAEGVSTVVVNGQIAFERGAMTAARPGRVLYGPGRK